MASLAEARLRKLCLSMPGATEKISWGAPTFRGPKRIFAMFAGKKNSYHGGREAVWVMAAPGRQGRMVRTHPARFFVPKYVGVMGWIGVWLDLAAGPPLPMPKKK
jgi:hypothetical protein